MTEPLFLLDPGALAQVAIAAEIELAGAEGRHAAAVRRIRPGERVRVADGVGRAADCLVTAAARDHLTLRVEALLDVAPPPLRLVLVQALAKGGRDEQAIETATELGVDAVVPWQAARSVVRWQGERGERARRRWVATVRAAAKQSRRPLVPEVEPLVATTAGLAERCRRADAALLLDAAAPDPLSSIPVPDQGEVLLVIGPEGGIEPAEQQALASAGAALARLGPEVLRASTAGPAALAVLAARTRW